MAQLTTSNRIKTRRFVSGGKSFSRSNFFRRSIVAGGAIALSCNFAYADIASDLAAGISMKGAILNAFLEGKDLREIQDELAENGWAVEFVIDSSLEQSPPEYWEDRRSNGLSDCGSPGGSLSGPIGSSSLACNVQCGFSGIGGGQSGLAMRCQAPVEEFDRPGVTDNLLTAEAVQSRIDQGIQAGFADNNSAPLPVPLQNQPAQNDQEPVQIASLPTQPLTLADNTDLGNPADLGTLLQTPENVNPGQLTLSGAESQWTYRLWDTNRTTGNATASNNEDSVNAVAVNTDGNIEEAVEIINNGGLCADGSRGFGNCGDPSPN